MLHLRQNRWKIDAIHDKILASSAPRLFPGVLVYAADPLMRQLCTIFTQDRIPPNDFLQLAYSHLKKWSLVLVVSIYDISTFAK